MAYLLYSICFFVVLFGTALYLLRARWLPLVPEVRLPVPRILLRGPGSYLYSRLPGSFADDAAAGLSSSNFDLAANVEAGDARAGLDAAAKAEILRIMKKRRMPFDEARRAYMQGRFSANGIGPDGRPRDPKFVSFS